MGRTAVSAARRIRDALRADTALPLGFKCRYARPAPGTDGMAGRHSRLSGDARPNGRYGLRGKTARSANRLRQAVNWLTDLICFAASAGVRCRALR